MNIPRERVLRAFAAAPDYDGQARMQRDVARALATRIAALDLPANPRVLEIGCGTGFLTRALIEAGLGGEWLVTDVAPQMVERCRASLGQHPGLTFAVLDGERGAPDGGPFDLVCSSLALQWFDDAPSALARMAGWLAPDGHAIVTTLGPASLPEWRAAHAAQGLSPGTPAFAPLDAFAALAPQALDVAHHVERHASPRAFLHALKAIGAGTPDVAHRPLSPARLRAVMERFGQSGCTATYEVVTCHLRRAR